MSCKCSCGESLDVDGKAHCLRHHRSFALKVGEECPDCARERDEGWVKATMGPPLGDPKFVIEALRQENADLKARVKELEKAARQLIKNGPCSDPDCCDTAIKNADARDNLAAALSLPTPGASSRLRETHYRECAEIVANEMSSIDIDPYNAGYNDGITAAETAILKKLEGK